MEGACGGGGGGGGDPRAQVGSELCHDGNSGVSNVAGTAPRHVILFYKYVSIGAENSIKKIWKAQEEVCRRLRLLGRVLVSKQGINGTLSGSPDCILKYKHEVEAFTVDGTCVFSGIEWKDSNCAIGKEPFPDLLIKLVKELVSSSGMEYNVDQGGVHLSPTQFHEALNASKTSGDAVVLDVRNRFEYELGRFDSAVQPNMRNYTQFSQFVDRNVEIFKDKNVYMYCTGGIRCETASAYLRKKGVAAGVYQLRGGIHKYCQKFSDPKVSLFRGKNFVFDRRIAIPTGSVIGQCSECGKAYDDFVGGVVCTVCVCLVLVCEACRKTGVPIAGSTANAIRREWYCREHTSLKDKYFTFLDHFEGEELERQLSDLRQRLHDFDSGEAEEDGSIRQRRRTVIKQISRVQKRISDMKSGAQVFSNPAGKLPCRSCMKLDCDGMCWGFWAAPKKQSP